MNEQFNSVLKDLVGPIYLSKNWPFDLESWRTGHIRPGAGSTTQKRIDSPVSLIKGGGGNLPRWSPTSRVMSEILSETIKLIVVSFRKVDPEVFGPKVKTGIMEDHS